MAKTDRESVSSLSHLSESPNVQTEEEDGALLLEEDIDNGEDQESDRFVNSELASGEDAQTNNQSHPPE